MVEHIIRMPPGHLPLEVYISDLAWKRIGTRQEELEIVAEERVVWTTLFGRRPLRAEPG